MAAEGLSHNEIWDDSALVRSWNDALEEYKKYHSMAAKGEKVEEILDAAEQDGDVLSKAPDVDASTGLPKWEPDTEEQAMDTDNTTEDNATSAGAMPEQNAPATSIAPPGPPSAPMPQGLLSSVHDENLKKLMMSWYFAGYYTGLHEGQQKAYAAYQAQQQNDKQVP